MTGRLRADDGIHFTAAGYELIAQKIIGTQGSVGRMRNKCGPGPGRAIGRAGLLRTGVLAICALLSLMSGPLLLENAAASAPLVILVLGDSLTAGLGVPREAAFPAQLEARLRAQGTVVRVVDKGISGDTTAGGLARVDRALAEKPDLVVLELGANDALRGIQPAVVRANLDAMITKVLASGTKLLLTGMRGPSIGAKITAPRSTGFIPTSPASVVCRSTPFSYKVSRRIRSSTSRTLSTQMKVASMCWRIALPRFLNI